MDAGTEADQRAVSRLVDVQIQDVLPITTVEQHQTVTQGPEQAVIACAAVEGVIAGIARKQVIARTTFQQILIVAAVEHIITCTPLQRVICVPAIQVIAVVVAAQQIGRIRTVLFRVGYCALAHDVILCAVWRGVAGLLW